MHAADARFIGRANASRVPLPEQLRGGAEVSAVICEHACHRVPPLLPILERADLSRLHRLMASDCSAARENATRRCETTQCQRDIKSASWCTKLPSGQQCDPS